VKLLALLAIFFVGTALAATVRPRQQYGAIAYHAPSKSVGWATDRGSSREARVDALKQCGHDECVVVVSVTRGCAALARDAKKFAVQKGATRQEAETKARGKCGTQCEIAAWACTTR
jgi:hypothetical protein